LLILFFGSMAAYVLAFSFSGNRAIYISAEFHDSQCGSPFVPLFIMMRDLRLLDTLWSLSLCTSLRYAVHDLPDVELFRHSA